MELALIIVMGVNDLHARFTRFFYLVNVSVCGFFDDLKNVVFLIS